MITSGIVRKIDDLGRVVLPKEIRKYLNINPGDDFKIEIEGNKITLEKFSKLGNYENQILNIINCFLGVIEEKIYLVVNNKLINHNNELINSIKHIWNINKIDNKEEPEIDEFYL